MGGLKRNGPHRPMCLKARPTENDTIRRCGLAEVGVVLLEEVGYCGWDLRSLKLKPSSPNVTQSPSVACGSSVELPAPSPAPCLPACCLASSRDDGLNLGNCKLASFIFSFMRVAAAVVSLHSNSIH